MKNKVQSFINIFGLSTWLAFLINEFSYDGYHKNIKHLYQLGTILIYCIGLFGIASFSAEQRTKEIGVRKALGASVSNIVTLLLKDFPKLAVISIIIASPIAWTVMHQWLQDFHYRIQISWIVFLITGLLPLIIALLTISYQAIRAALVNPVNRMKSE